MLELADPSGEVARWRERIDVTMAAIAARTDVPRWVWNDESVVARMCGRSDRAGGAWTRRGEALLAAIPWGPWRAAVFSALAAFRAAKLWLLAKRRTEPPIRDGAAVFVGHGAGGENGLWEEFRRQFPGRAVRLGSGSESALQQIGRPSLRCYVVRLAKDGSAAFRGLERAFAHANRDGILGAWAVSSAKRLGRYSFGRALAETGDRFPSLVAFTYVAPEAAGILDATRRPRVRYAQHGFLRRSVMPLAFDDIEALTSEEADHMARSAPRAKVSRSGALAIARIEAGRAALLVGAYDLGEWRQDAHAAEVDDFVSWCREREIAVWVRRHPVDKSPFWKERFPNLRDATEPPTFAAALEMVRPFAVASWWYSTSFLEARAAGLCTVLLPSMPAFDLADLVFTQAVAPFQWPEDADRLEALIPAQAVSTR